MARVRHTPPPKGAEIWLFRYPVTHGLRRGEVPRLRRLELADRLTQLQVHAADHLVVDAVFDPLSASRLLDWWV